MSLPQKMRAVEIAKPGGPEVLNPAERPLPSPKPNEILVKVAAAGVNRPDILQRMGLYAVPPDASDLPGLEIAGEVAACGAAVTMWKPGDKVCALVHGGGYAEYCVTPEVQALPVPKGLSLVEAASLPETFFTVWSNVFDRAGLKPGESFLVHGGSSGIGVTAIQMAKAHGATVIVTVGSDEKAAACKALGADHAINYKTHDFADEVKRITGKAGVNVILGMVAGAYVEREIGCMAPDGRLVIIAVQGGTDSKVDAGLVLRNRLTVTGSTLRPRPVAFKSAIAASLKRTVWPWLEQGTVKPVIHEVFPAAEAARAHALMETNAHIGKLVLQW